MKRKFTLLLLAAALLAGLAACGASGQAKENTLNVAAATYPVYLFTTAITEGVDGVSVELMVNQQTSCLHDYTLTIRDMKLVDRADVLVLSGGGLEEFLDAALAQTDAPVIDCSAGLDLLPAQEEHEGHDHGGDVRGEEYDPHYWLSRAGAEGMLENIAAGLCGLDPDHAGAYGENLAAALDLLAGDLPDFSGLSCPYLVTFHDGFQYFAADCGLTILKAIEEEEGAEASARDIKEVLELIEAYRLPAIFVEANSSDATARAIAWEAGCQVYTLDLIMSGEGTGLQPYLDAMNANYNAISQALSPGTPTPP